MIFSKEIMGYYVSMTSLESIKKWKARIILYERINNIDTPVIDLRFVKKPSNFFSLQKVQENGLSVIYDSIDHFPVYIDFLRNTRPINAILNEAVTGSPAYLVLSEKAEPVGEGFGDPDEK